MTVPAVFIAVIQEKLRLKRPSLEVPASLQGEAIETGVAISGGTSCRSQYDYSNKSGTSIS